MLPETDQLHIENLRELYEERAAMGEYEGGLSRQQAELQALNSVWSFAQQNNIADRITIFAMEGVHTPVPVPLL